jgi:hypothetical protein
MLQITILDVFERYKSFTKKKYPGQEQEEEFEPKAQNLPSKAILWAPCFFFCLVIIFFLTPYF